MDGGRRWSAANPSGRSNARPAATDGPQAARHVRGAAPEEAPAVHATCCSLGATAGELKSQTPYPIDLLWVLFNKQKILPIKEFRVNAGGKSRTYFVT